MSDKRLEVIGKKQQRVRCWKGLSRLCSEDDPPLLATIVEECRGRQMADVLLVFLAPGNDRYEIVTENAWVFCTVPLICIL